MKLSTLLRRSKNTTRATAIEYALIATLIAVAVIAGASTLGNQLNKVFTEIERTTN